MEYDKKIEYATRINAMLRGEPNHTVLKCLEVPDRPDWYLMKVFHIIISGDDIIVRGTELKSNYGRCCNIENVVDVYTQNDDKLLKLFDVERQRI